MFKEIHLASLNLGKANIKVPYFSRRGNRLGPNLVITAGSDGDEYAGIEAAYQLIKEFNKGNFNGKLSIIPILNIPGFESHLSKNPLDGKFPKLIYPGEKNGTASERLMYWLEESFLCDASVWLDMHGGAINELLRPFVIFYETGNDHIKEKTREILRSLEAERIVLEHKNAWLKVERLAKKDIAYVLTESGESGKREKKCIDMHVRWAKDIMRAFGILGTKKEVRQENKTVFRGVYEYRTKRKGLWVPSITPTHYIQEGMTLGTICSYEGEEMEKIISNKSGELLWSKESLYCEKGDTLFALGINPENLE